MTMDQITREQLDEVLAKFAQMNNEQLIWMLVLTSLLVVVLSENEDNLRAMEEGQKKLDSVLTVDEKAIIQRVQDEVNALS